MRKQNYVAGSNSFINVKAVLKPTALIPKPVFLTAWLFC